MSSRLRLDELLVAKDFFPSRSRASDIIKQGKVLVNGEIVKKPGKKVPSDVKIEISDFKDYVGRGYLKLEKALAVFRVNPEGKRVCDIGASTGGFTQLLLEKGAKIVYAVDVGKDQLHASLRSNPRVCVMEGTDVRNLSVEMLNGCVDLITADLSFISLTKVVEVFGKLLCEKGECIALVKPQFEAGPDFVQRGKVKDPAIHDKILERVIKAFEGIGFSVCGLDYSPITGKTGNIEHLLYSKLDTNVSSFGLNSINKVVSEAFNKILDR